MRKQVLFCLIALLLLLPGCNNTKSIVVTFSPSVAQALDIGQTFNISVTVSNDKLNKGATITLTGVGTLTNVTATGATYTATASGSAKVTIASVTDPTKTYILNIVVTVAPSITTGPLAAATEGTTYSASVTSTETGGAGTLTYTVLSGSLPAGLTLSGSGTISGAPTGPNGPATFTVKVTDSSTVSPQSSSVSFTITVNLPALPTISPTPAPTTAVEFTSYSYQVVATGYAPLVYSITVGSLPAELTLSASSGLISGTPKGPAGPVGFTVQVADHSNPTPQTATQPFTITVNEPTPPSITTTSPLPNGTTGVLYTQTLSATGGHAPLTWAFVTGSGTLPPPLASIPSNGQISFTPSTAGVYTFKVQVTDSSNPPQVVTSSLLSITITNGPLAVTAQTLPTGAVGEAYPATSIAATGGVPAYTWSITSAPATFPPGLAFTSTGAITNSPSPSAAGTYNFTAQVKDFTNATATGNFTIVINAALAVSTTSLPSGTQGASYTTTLAATGGVTPYSWSITSGTLPTDLTLTSNTISGIPTVSGTFPITVQVTDALGGTASSTGLSIVLAAAPALSVTTTSGNLPAGTANVAYTTTQLNASGGIQPYTWLLVSPGTGPLPPDLSLSTSGQITGTPTTAGTYPFTVQVKDSVSTTATADLSITVSAASACDTTHTGKESLLKGDYAFVLKGFDSNGHPALVGGVFVASGAAGANNITPGTLDLNLNAGEQYDLSMTSGSTYNLGEDSTNGYRGCMTFVTSAGTQHYAFSVDSIVTISGVTSASNGHMIDFDTTGPFTTGILRQATSSAFSTSAITGNWAFGINGPEPGGGNFAAAGVVTFASGSVSGVGDWNDNGTLDNDSLLTSFPSSPETLSSGPYLINSNGRGTMTFTPGGVGGSPADFFIYVVSSTEMLSMAYDSVSNNSASGGRALKQSGISVTSGTTEVLYTSGLSSSSSTDSKTELALIAIGSSHSFTYSGYKNDGGSISSPTSDPSHNSVSGTYSVASNGRVTLTVSGAKNLPVFYLSSANTAFALNSDGGATSGFFQPQSGSPFSATSASGAYGLGVIDPAISGISDKSGMATFTPATTSVSGWSDKNAQGTLTPDNPLSSTYSVDHTGVGLMPSGCTLTGASADCANLFIVVSPTNMVMMDVDPTKTNPVITIFEH